MSIIAISRGTFSGGEALATGVAERLGYRCMSREVLLEAAWGYGVSVDKLDAASLACRCSNRSASASF